MHAGAVRNGNELALNYAEAGPEKRSAFFKEREGMMHVFRFLRIQSIEGLDEENRDVTLTTTEPSSDATVVLVVPASRKKSRQLASELRTGDCVAAHGQIHTMTDANPPVFRVSPALLDHQDRAQPKAGREMLDEMKRGP